MKTNTLRCFCLGIGLLSMAARSADPLLSAAGMARMPVREVTVFKDGHAFVTHQGKMPTDAGGQVVMDYLPAPVLGTFWPYSAEERAKLVSVTAGQRRVQIARSPLTVRELIEANPGAEVIVTEVPVGKETVAPTYPATILRVTERSAAELERTAPPNTGDLLPQKGDVVLLKTEAGTRAIEFSRILDVTFRSPPENTLETAEFRSLLTLRLDWEGRTPPPTAEVGLTYLQRGIRWIPQYKLVIDGNGTATVQLQAALLNEMTDLEDVTCHLVVGVPTFRFRETVDPMSLQQALVQLSAFFREPGGSRSGAQHGQYQMLSNAIMTQTMRMTETRGASASAGLGADLGQEEGGGENVEDLHIFTVEHVSLRKGERLVMPVAEYSVPYEDVFVVHIPCAPPHDVRHRFSSRQRDEIARMLASPKAIHKLRIANKSAHPFTTAPALVLRDDHVLAQGLMTYTPKGGSVDLPLTASVDVQVKKSEKEADRVPNGARWRDLTFERVELEGTLTLTNFGKRPARIEVVRHVLGQVTQATEGGDVVKLNTLEDDTGGPTGLPNYPYWWGWWDWPAWWGQLNGVARIRWETNLRAGKSVDLHYQWYYFWR